MEPPELVAEEENYEDNPSIEVAPPKLSPVKELVPEKKPAQVIVQNGQDVIELMDSLNLENHLPSYNVEEKIIIALDTSQEDKNTYFLGQGDEEISPFYALKSAVEMFVRLKQHLHRNHEFALVLLNERKPSWHCNFTRNVKEYIEILNDIVECQAGEKFDLSSLFTDLVSKVRTCDFFSDQRIPPPYLVRVVLLYSRSNTIPHIELVQNIKDLFNCPYFILDVLVSHEPVSESNNCKKIFQFLQSLDTKGLSYFFNVGRNMDALTRSMIKLVGHPLQRPIQVDADYSL